MTKAKRSEPTSLADWADDGSPTRSRRSGSVAASSFERARTEALERRASGEWEGAEARHFVAAYAIAHEQVYEVAPAELGPALRHRAGGMASRMLAHHFGGDSVAMAKYFYWVWHREVARERWKRANGRSGGRIGVGLIFGGELVTDWRLDAARKRGHSGGRCAGDG